jgi:hypothetical protein
MDIEPQRKEQELELSEQAFGISNSLPLLYFYLRE